MAFRKALISQCQRNRVLFLAPIALALVFLFVFAQNHAAIAAAWQSPLSILKDRSPGERSAGALYNTKPDHRKLAELVEPGPLGGFPQERVLAATRVRPDLADLLPDEVMPLDVTGGVPALDGAAPLALGLPSLGSGSSSRSSPSFGLGPGAGPLLASDPGPELEPDPTKTESPTPTETQPAPPPEGLPTPPPGGQPTPPPTEVSSPVPEPTTWAMNIVGLFLVGGAMRSRSRKGRAIDSGTAALLRG